MDDYPDVYNVYKGLIALRKSTTAFTAGTTVSAEKLANGITKYTADNYLVYFNATSAAYTIDTTGYTTVVTVDTGIVDESPTLPASVPAKGFVILKQ
ncbi:hypothetical protein K7I13_11155 [Brucepastera parasyntrophica]|uniref:hypothetical protein n=1 Tax=Brucepastera parasyntrophica TaxID=2880008 RepID=UPI00210B9A7E|nr:hypothetical protein [Brucepastera parasyntrophica]ULQ59063.1 hypothetical protein K7I13_11155 [Brucepastera parasyntrophica]